MRYLLVIILALSASAFAQTDEQRAAIADRIKSFSNVCVAGRIAAVHLSLMRRLLHFPVKQSTQAALHVTANGGWYWPGARRT